MDAVWDGTRRVRTLTPENNTLRQTLADAAKAGDWNTVLRIIGEHAGMVNSTRPGGSSLYSPLHQAAYTGADKHVIDRLVALGAWRTLRNAQGERPIDVARKVGHCCLVNALSPVLKAEIPNHILQRIQHNFHLLIHSRVDDLINEHCLRLPELEPLLERGPTKMWFAVPGMYGGFRFWFERDGNDPTLISESWCRVSEGSGQRHAINSLGFELVDEGFV